jgi:hypothetical protein
MKEQIKYLIYLIASIIILLFALEFSITVLLKNPKLIPSFALPVFKDYYYHHDRRMIQLLPHTSEYSSELFYTLKPGKFVFKNREFANTYYVNSQGMRDKSKNLKNPRILFLGDSFTMGWGVEQRETFPYLVEKALNKKSLNTGVSSYGTARESIIASPYINDSLEFVVIQYCLNDYDENRQFIKNNFQLEISDFKTLRRTKINHLKSIKYRTFKHLTGIAYFVKHRTKLWVKNQHKSNLTLEPIAGKQFYKIIENMNLPEHVQIIAFSLDLNQSTPYFINQLSKIKEENNLENWHLIDFSEKLQKKHYYRLDGHLNKSGQEVVANEISKMISELL